MASSWRCVGANRIESCEWAAAACRVHGWPRSIRRGPGLPVLGFGLKCVVDWLSESDLMHGTSDE
jgi:hypothetical protein